MFKINLNFLKPGMILAKTINGSDGQVLLNAGVILKESYIEKLRQIGISSLYIDTKETSDIVIEDVICEQNRFEAKNIIRETMKDVYMGRSIQTKEVFEAVSNILDDLLGNKDIMLNLSDIKAVDDYTFAHSVNVCVLSLITGITMGYNRDKLEKLGIGAVLHDIGKIAIPPDILNKPGKLTDIEYKIIQEHPRLGYDIVKEHATISSLSAMVILTHHERHDGKGYPLGKKGKEIFEFSRIVAVADVYDALTSDRVYKKKVLPHEAIEYLRAMGDLQFDSEIVNNFAAHVAPYPVGTIVKLSTGVQGIVVAVDKNHLNKPKVRCFWNKQGDQYLNEAEVNLVNLPSITISEVLEKLE
ncbi:HD-GYP domain-containing protein [Crassaminicella profunda]|uniref:HD-GYP domain-containing protein n=1 Tax=Crassaminicella profunda TaxID=1286698 RepID=UPI001CA6FF24|nr:HD-GYP domain-containing protein [Crassaminicella profunda]QZY56029.1 HD-GYP domain-containing protein [Crassaminicella profunda]